MNKGAVSAMEYSKFRKYYWNYFFIKEVMQMNTAACLLRK